MVRRSRVEWFKSLSPTIHSYFPKGEFSIFGNFQRAMGTNFFPVLFFYLFFFSGRESLKNERFCLLDLAGFTTDHDLGIFERTAFII